ALIVGLLPKGSHVFDCLDCLLAVDGNGIAVGLDLLATEGPQEWIGEGHRIADRLPERLSNRPPLRLELLSGLTVLVPSLGKLRNSNFIEPRFPIGDESAYDSGGHSNPTFPIVAVAFGAGIVSALSLADVLGNIADVGDARVVEMRMIVEQHYDIRAGACLDRGGDARLQVIEIDAFKLNLETERFLGFSQQVTQHLIGSGNVIAPSQPVQACPLRVAWGLARG